MPKQKAQFPQKHTHFEKVPLEVVVKIAVIDPPLERTPALVEPIPQPSPPTPQSRTRK